MRNGELIGVLSICRIGYNYLQSIFLILAISQRDCTKMYAELASQKPTLRRLILTFFDDNLSSFPMPNYVFDVYVSKQQRVYLVDVAHDEKMCSTPLFDVNGGLFQWDEIDTIAALREKEESEGRK